MSPRTAESVRSRLRFAPRFVGPFPGWVNGGVIAGRLAALAGAPTAAVEVRISRPVPIDVVLDVEIGPDDLRLVAGAEVLASARAVDRDLVAPPPVPPDQARRNRPLLDPANHPAPGCFVCGPEHPDGLDLQPGGLPGRTVVATLWHPRSDLAGQDGVLPSHVVWAALDCPSWYGAARGEPALLGSMTARQQAPIPVGRPVVVSGWGSERDGRKTHAGAALHNVDGDLLAVATSIWIHPKGT